MKQAIVLLLTLQLLLISCSQLQAPSNNPVVRSLRIDNPYYPLVPGTTYIYESHTEEGLEKNIVIVTDKTKNVSGVMTRVVWDRVWVDDELLEETNDYYAQDEQGNVWYYGELSTEYEDGEVLTTKGSWEAGVNGAVPGIIMKAKPKIGDSYAQELLVGEAEDMGDVISLDETVTVPRGTFSGCLKTRDWSKIDATLNEYKYYCRGIGMALEVGVESGERTELISMSST